MSYVTDFLPMILDFMNDDPCFGVYHQATNPVYDPSTSTNNYTNVDISVQVILQDLTRNSNGLSSVFGTEILAGDKECMMLPPEYFSLSPSSLTVNTTSDTMTVAGILYKVVNMKSADPTGASSILYQLMLRRQE